MVTNTLSTALVKTNIVCALLSGVLQHQGVFITIHLLRDILNTRPAGLVKHKTHSKTRSVILNFQFIKEITRNVKEYVFDLSVLKVILFDLLRQKALDKKSKLDKAQLQQVSIELEMSRDELARQCNKAIKALVTKPSQSKVLNLYKDSIDNDGFYIGRPGVFGNPHVVSNEIPRGQACKLFAKTYDESSQLQTLYVTHLSGYHVFCYCAPKACHGDVFLNYKQSK